MTITEWNKYIDSLKVNITKIYDKCREEIKKVVAESSRFNPAESLARGSSMSDKISGIISDANNSTIGLLYEAINNASSIAKENNNQNLANIIVSLQKLLSVAKESSVKKDAKNKKSSMNNMIERRYMWQFYEEAVDQAKYYGLVTAETIIDDDPAMSILEDIADISKLACEKDLDKELTNIKLLIEEDEPKKKKHESIKSIIEKEEKTVEKPLEKSM